MGRGPDITLIQMRSVSALKIPYVVKQYGSLTPSRFHPQLQQIGLVGVCQTNHAKFGSTTSTSDQLPYFWFELSLNHAGNLEGTSRFSEIMFCVAIILSSAGVFAE